MVARAMAWQGEMYMFIYPETSKVASTAAQTFFLRFKEDQVYVLG
jgi:hypothetical protein